MLNNRELAVSAWLVVGLALSLRSADVRSSLFGVMRAIASLKLVVPFLLGAVYTGLVALALERLGIWTPSLLKDTIFWLLFTGASTAFALVGNWQGGSVASHFAADALKITVVVEFLTSEYTLSLPAELVLVPVLLAVGIMSAISETDTKFSTVKRLLVGVQAILSLLIIGVAIQKAVADWKSLETLATLWKFLLPLLLSLAFVPFAYALLLLSTYESLFVRLHAGSPDDSAFRARAKRRIVANFGLNLAALHEFSSSGGRRIYAARSDADLAALLGRASMKAAD